MRFNARAAFMTEGGVGQRKNKLKLPGGNSLQMWRVSKAHGYSWWKPGLQWQRWFHTATHCNHGLSAHWVKWGCVILWLLHQAISSGKWLKARQASGASITEQMYVEGRSCATTARHLPGTWYTCASSCLWGLLRCAARISKISKRNRSEEEANSNSVWWK